MILLVIAASAAIILISRSAQASDDGDSQVKNNPESGDDGFFDYEFTDWNRFDGFFDYWGRVYNVDKNWLKAIAMNESSLGKAKSVEHGIKYPNDIEKSKSFDGLSWGLMQVTIRTARELDPSATEAKLNDPDYSVKLAAMYLGRLKKMFSMADPRYTEYVIKSYNQGPGNTQKREMKGLKGYADEYWDRFQRNYKKVVGQ